MATITLYKDKINSVGSLLDDIIKNTRWRVVLFLIDLTLNLKICHREKAAGKDIILGRLSDNEY